MEITRNFWSVLGALCVSLGCSDGSDVLGVVDDPAHGGATGTGAEACIPGTGNPIIEQRPVSQFDGIVVKAPVDVEFTSGSPISVEVEAQPEFAERLTATVRDRQ